MRLKKNIDKSRKNMTLRFTKWNMMMFYGDVHKNIKEFN